MISRVANKSIRSSVPPAMDTVGMLMDLSPKDQMVVLDLQASLKKEFSLFLLGKYILQLKMA